MRPLLRTALAAVACVALAACSDEPTSASRTPTVVRPSLEVAAAGLLQVITPCDINALKADARLYTNKSNDVLQTIIGDLAAAVRNGASSAGDDKAFDGLARMAAIRGTPAQKPGVTGEVFDRLVKRFVGCMQEHVYANVNEPDPPTVPGTLGGGFKQALGGGWVFEVRGKSSDPSGPAFERSTTTPQDWWAVDVPGGAWATAISSSLTDCTVTPIPAVCDRVLIFGWRRDFIPSLARAGSAFEHRTIPDVNTPLEAGDNFTLAADVGLCVTDASPIEVNLATQRVNHDSKFLELADPIRCGLTTPPLVTEAHGSLAFRQLNPMRVARRAVDFLMPQLAHASMFDGGSITGRPDDFSPSAVIDLSQVKLVFDTIANGFVNTALVAANTTPPREVRVYAYTLDNVAIPGVDVVVTIAGNSSVISAFGGVNSDSVTITPTSVTAKGTPEGYAKLTGVTLTKAGGFTLAARVNVADFEGATLFNSLAFNIQNK
jgi:hypothetical protein